MLIYFENLNTEEQCTVYCPKTAGARETGRIGKQVKVLCELVTVSGNAGADATGRPGRRAGQPYARGSILAEAPSARRPACGCTPPEGGNHEQLVVR